MSNGPKDAKPGDGKPANAQPGAPSSGDVKPGDGAKGVGPSGATAASSSVPKTGAGPGGNTPAASGGGTPAASGGDKPAAAGTANVRPPSSAASSATKPPGGASSGSPAPGKPGAPAPGSGTIAQGAAAKGVAAKPASPPPPPPLPPVKETARKEGGRSGFGAGLVGGLIGAAVVAGGAYLLGQQGVIALGPQVDPATLDETSSAVDEVGQRLDALEQELQAAPEATSDSEVQAALDASGERLGQIEARLEELAAGAPAGDSAALDDAEGAAGDLAARLEQLEQRLAAGADAQGVAQDVGESADRLQQLETRLERLAATPAAPGFDEDALLARAQEPLAGVNARLDGIDEQLSSFGEVEQRIATLAERVDNRLDEVERRLEARRGESAEIGQRFGAFEEETRTGLSGLREEVNAGTEALRGDVQSLAAGTQERLASLGEQVERLTGEVASYEAERERAVGAALLLDEIRQNLDRGEAVREQALALVELGGAELEEPAARLNEAARVGVPSVDTLLFRLDQVEEAVSGAEGGGVNEVVGNLTSLVQVRGPNAPAAGVAAVEQAREALNRPDPDVEAAIGAIEGLPEEQRSLPAVQIWLEAANARVQAFEATDGLAQAVRGLLTSTD